MPHKLHPASFVRMGLEIEDQQYAIRVLQFTKFTYSSIPGSK